MSREPRTVREERIAQTIFAELGHQDLTYRLIAAVLAIEDEAADRSLDAIGKLQTVRERMTDVLDAIDELARALSSSGEDR